jgi:RNA polymerase sigma-70 factor (ECF subfamily)
MEKQFCSLVSRYENQVYSLAYYILADAAEAEDVAQESFIKLWQHLKTIEAAAIGTWLMRVAHNGSLDRLRKRRIQVALEDEPLAIDQRYEPDTQLERESIKQKLMAAIHQLEEPWRSLLILRDIHEHSYEDVAEILKLKVNQVKVYLHRARKKLSEQWYAENT